MSHLLRHHDKHVTWMFHIFVDMTQIHPLLTLNQLTTNMETKKSVQEARPYDWKRINREAFERDRISSEANKAIVERRNTEGVKIRVHNLLKK